MRHQSHKTAHSLCGSVYVKLKKRQTTVTRSQSMAVTDKRWHKGTFLGDRYAAVDVCVTFSCAHVLSFLSGLPLRVGLYRN